MTSFPCKTCTYGMRSTNEGKLVCTRCGKPEPTASCVAWAEPAEMFAEAAPDEPVQSGSDRPYLIEVDGSGRLPICTGPGSCCVVLRIKSVGREVSRTVCAVCGVYGTYCIRIDASMVADGERKLAPLPPPPPPAWKAAWQRDRERLCALRSGELCGSLEAGASVGDALASMVESLSLRAYMAGWEACSTEDKGERDD